MRKEVWQKYGLFMQNNCLPRILLFDEKTGINKKAEAVAERSSVKKVLLKISQNSQEDTCVGVSFLIKLEVSGNFVKKEALTQVFFCEFCEAFKNIYRTYAEHFFYRTYAVAASEKGVSYQ